MQRCSVFARILAGTLVILVARVATASAYPGGINLSWNDCGPWGTLSKTFACTSNTLSGAILIASAIAPVQVDQLNGQESEIQIQTNQVTLSPWWHLESGGCRGTAISASFDFTGGPFNCLDPWSGQAAGGMNYVAGYPGPNRAQLRTICAIAGSTSITGIDEYYFFKITLLGQKSTGTGSCAGCADGACIVFKSIKLTEPAGVGDYTLTDPITRQYVTFQPGGNLSGQCPPIEDIFPTRASRATTWGSVKSLYR